MIKTRHTVYETEQPTRCEWFARCDELTTYGLDSGHSGVLPCCERCAHVVGIDITTGEEL